MITSRLLFPTILTRSKRPTNLRWLSSSTAAAPRIRSIANRRGGIEGRRRVSLETVRHSNHVIGYPSDWGGRHAGGGGGGGDKHWTGPSSGHCKQMWEMKQPEGNRCSKEMRSRCQGATGGIAGDEENCRAATSLAVDNGEAEAGSRAGANYSRKSAHPNGIPPFSPPSIVPKEPFSRNGPNRLSCGAEDIAMMLGRGGVVARSDWLFVANL